MKSRSTQSNDLHERTQDALQQLETTKLQAFERSKKFYLLKLAQQESELPRLVKKFGEENPRVKKIASQVNVLKNFNDSLDILIRIMKPQEPMEKTSWRIQGLITDRMGNPILERKVSVVVEEIQHGEDKRTKGLGPWSTHTNEAGFYAIILTEMDLKTIEGLKVSLHVSERKKEKVMGRPLQLLSPRSGIIDVFNFVSEP